MGERSKQKQVTSIHNNVMSAIYVIIISAFYVTMSAFYVTTSACRQSVAATKTKSAGSETKKPVVKVKSEEKAGGKRVYEANRKRSRPSSRQGTSLMCSHLVTLHRHMIAFFLPARIAFSLSLVTT